MPLGPEVAFMTNPVVMRATIILLAFCCTLQFFRAQSKPAFGFNLPDSLEELTMNFSTRGNLIILPVVINKSIAVNLILDTGCRNLVLFGKKFSSLLQTIPGKSISFSGLGNGEPVTGKLSVNNLVEINSITGDHLPIVIVENKNLFRQYQNIHGVIGYDLFLKFEIEINFKLKQMNFRPAQTARPRADFNTVRLNIVDSKPFMQSAVTVNNQKSAFALMIDTGSALGLILRMRSSENINSEKSIVGIGLNGNITGYVYRSGTVDLDDMVMKNVTANVIESTESDGASIGMGALKNYIVVLNYCQAYASFRENLV